MTVLDRPCGVTAQGDRDHDDDDDDDDDEDGQGAAAINHDDDDDVNKQNKLKMMINRTLMMRLYMLATMKTVCWR